MEAKRLLFSKAMTRLPWGRKRKLLFIDVKKTHLNRRCEEGVDIELPLRLGRRRAIAGS